MHIRMRNGEGLSVEQINEFLKGSEGVSFAGQDKREVYGWVESLLGAQEFLRQDKKRRGAIRAYMEKVTGLGSAQVTRLVRMFKETGTVEVRDYQRQEFPRKYTDRDVVLLAEVDRAHERLSGPNQFPFRILGFHSDNGSEYINHTVARLLDKLLIEFTKSRACRSQDNALVESKNGAVIRKHIGYGHIAGLHAEALRYSLTRIYALR